MSPKTLAVLLLTAVIAGPACSVRKLAVNRIGDALASSTSSTLQSDEDVELIGDALPFGLKLMEALIAESPRNQGLLLAACQGFCLYSYAYVQQPADRVMTEDLERANQMRERARRLFQRARGYGLRALELAYPGAAQKLENEPAAALARARVRDVPLLYWNAAALGLAVSVSRNDAEMLSRVPEVEALLRRAIELDEDWQQGSLHEFQIVLASAKPGGGLDVESLRKHFDRAVELSGGNRAGVFTAWAESISIRTQNRREFRTMLEKALAVNPGKVREWRLLNEISQRRARWLLSRADELFLEEEKP